MSPLKNDTRSYVIALGDIKGDDPEDTALLVEMAKQAERYIRSFDWCLSLREGRFVDGFGGIIALFLFKVTIRKVSDEEWVWVFVGDMPSAYLETEGFNTPHSALTRYLEGLEEWVTAARAGDPLEELIPIDLSPSPEAIELLLLRVKSLRREILPHISNLPTR